jgi:hypothetical protein
MTRSGLGARKDDAAQQRLHKRYGTFAVEQIDLTAP